MHLYLKIKTLAFNMKNKNKPFQLIQEKKNFFFQNFHSILFFLRRSIHELKITKICRKKNSRLNKMYIHFPQHMNFPPNVRHCVGFLFFFNIIFFEFFRNILLQNIKWFLCNFCFKFKFFVTGVIQLIKKPNLQHRLRKLKNVLQPLN